MNNIAKNIAISLVIMLVLSTVFNQFTGQNKQDGEMAYSQFMQEVKKGQIASVSVEGRVIHGITQDKKEFTTYLLTWLFW